MLARIAALSMGLLLAPLVNSEPSLGQDLLAASFFPAAGDDDPRGNIDGVFKIDLATGEAQPFIPEGTAGLVGPASIAVGPHDGHIYVGSNASGQIYVFDGQSGQPLTDANRGIVDGLFADVGAGVGIASLAFDVTNILHVSASPGLDVTQGFVARIDGENGARLTDAVPVIEFPNGLALTSDNRMLVAEGDLFTPGSVVAAVDGEVTTFIADDNGQFADANAMLQLPPPGDYDLDGDVDGGSFLHWQGTFGAAAEPAGSGADGNENGIIDAGDLEVWQANLGASGDILVADFLGHQVIGEVKGNPIIRFDAEGQNPELWNIVGPHIPDVPPPGVFLLSNFPSQLLLTDDRTVLLGTLGLTNRPENRGAVFEYDVHGDLLRTIADDLPPISSIALAPPATGAGAPIPEPAAGLLAILALLAGGGPRVGRSFRPVVVARRQQLPMDHA